MTDREYLEATHITRLQSAARMAGLRWKSGDPAYSKAGIISKLENHPSIMRATLGVLQRMNKDEPQARNPLLDDIDDDTRSESSQQPAPAQPPSAQTPIAQAIPQQDLAPLVRRIDSLERRATDAEGILNTHGKTLAANDKAIGVLVKAVESLQERKPIQFNFPERPPIIIDPDEHHERFADLIRYLQVNRRVILTGSAGTGKSMAVKNAAKILDVPFYLVPPVTMSHELIGHRDAQGVFHETPLTMAYKHGGLCLLDEADASLPDALLCANPILDGNGFATLGDGELATQHPNFMAVFNMNTDGNGATMQYAGRNRLDGATLARFGVRIHWHVDARIEAVMALGETAWYSAVLAVRKLMTERDIVDVNATPRHTKTGAALLKAGCTRKAILTDVLRSGALDACWDDVERLPAVQSFLRG